MEGNTVTLDTVSTSLTDGLGEMVNSMLGVIGDILPGALLVVGAGLIVGVGIKIFKKVTGK